MGPKVTSTIQPARESRALFFFSWVGGPEGHKHTCDNLTQRHYVTLTQRIAVRCYDALLIIFSMSSQLSTASGSALSSPFNKS